MPIKAIKLRAVFLLLLFTLLFISSSSLIRKVNADSLEESFKNTPLPFWDIETENVLVQYGTNTQDISFSYAMYSEDFSDVSEWDFNYAGSSDTYYFVSDNGIGTMAVFCDNANSENVRYEYVFDSAISLSHYLKIKSFRCSNSKAYIRFYDSSANDVSLQIGGLSWIVDEISFQDYSDTIDNVKEIHIYISDYPNSFAGGFIYGYFDYIQIQRDYQNNMVDVSDWSFVSESSGLPSRSFTTDGDILTFQIGYDDAGNEWAKYETDISSMSGFDYFEIYYRTSNSTAPTKSTRFSVILDTDTILSSYTDTWYYWSKHDITETYSTLTLMIDDYSNTHATDYGYALIDYINFGFYNGRFNVSIPIERFKNQKFEFMLDTDNLENTAKINFGIFQNTESMNYDFYLQNKFFTQRDFSFNYSEYNFLRLVLDLKYSTNYFRISVYDENNSKLFSNIIYEYVRKTGDNFKISSENITGWFHLYYFTGNVDYSTIWTETIYSEDTDITNNLLGASAVGNDAITAHNISYNRYVSNFQFLRTNLNLWSYFSVDHSEEIGIYISTQLFYPNGTEAYKVELQFRRGTQSLRYYLTVYEDNIIVYWGSALTGALGVESQTNIQFAVWRTQDNKLGAVVYTDDTFTNYYGDIAPFVSDFELKNFQANVTLNYYSETPPSGYRNFILELNGFELGYGNIEGVAEPHFSTTWWESIPLIGPIVNAFILIGNTIGLLIESGLTPINAILDSIFGAIGGIAGAVWVLFESALSDLGISIDAVASDVFGFFDSILTSISGLVDDVFTAIVNLNDNFVAWVIEGITDALVPALVAGIDSMMDALFALWEYQLNLVGIALGWGAVGTFLFDFTDSVVLTIPSWLAFIINANVLMMDILIFSTAMYDEYGATFLTYGALFVAIDIIGAVITLDLDKIGECLGKYIKVILWIVEFMLNIISTILNVIWGLLPF